MKICNFYKPMLAICMLALFSITGVFANNEHPPKNTNELEMLTCNGGSQIAYWSLNDCESFSSNGSNLDYSEFTASTNTPSGFSSVTATGLTHEGGHSCTQGESGYAICSEIRNSCSWNDNDSDAFRFSVTVTPSNGSVASLTGLDFYEAAPLTYSHISGNTGDNDPPSHYGIRVLKNGQEIYQSTGKNTTHNWSLESFDFTSDSDFEVSSQTTFEFELLGYCRSNGTSGLAVWDLDEIKVFGCSEVVDPCAGQGGDSDGDGVCNNQDCQPNNPNFPATPGSSCNDGNPNTNNDVVSANGCNCAGTPIDPCAGQGGDSDGDGVCNNQDCQPNNPAFPATPGSSCNDGNPNTTNDVVTANGCNCAGTPTGPACNVSTNGCSITITGLNGSDYAKVFDSNWQIVWECNPWNGGCSGTETITNLNNGTYNVQACGSTTPYTVSGCSPVDPCAGQGGDSDGDGVCNNSDCQPNNPAFPATPGSSCNDGNPSTNNDVVTGDGCGCAGTPVGPACSVSTNGCSITITGLDGSDYAKVFDSNWSIVWECNPWNGGCSGTETITNLNNGTYNVQACGSTTPYTVSGCTPVDPCAGQGGDSDGDGVCNNSDCQPNNPAFPATPGSSCNDGNPNTTNDVVTGDGCGCAGTPVGPACSVSTNGCSITITGLDGSDYAKVFDSNWQIVWECNPWNGGCSGTETITNLNNGTYNVQACGSTTPYTVSGCTPVDPCAGQGGDSDGDGVCNNSDCQPNNPAFPATPGSSCNDGNPNTTNDVVTGDGCGCAGTPVGPACSVSTDGCSITITGLDGSDYAKVFDSNWSIVWQCNPWNGGCSGTETITNLSNGTYNVQACGSTTPYTVSGCTPVDPCAGQGGDSDGDGVCNNSDCQPNNPAFPATPGSSCNDGNPNTTNDVVTGDGCGCAGTPVGPSCDVAVNGCTITISGLSNNDYTKVFDANWQIVWECNPWVNGGCNSTETITDLSNGTYYVQACGSTNTYTLSGCTPVDPCAGQGGDSDGDGVCNNADCQPNNPNFPATPGSSCNDGNPNTENDVVMGDGCSCAGTPIVPNPCNEVTSIRRAKNLSSNCANSNQAPRVIWIEGALCREIGDLYFIEYNDGTAVLKGRVQEVDGNAIFDVDVDFTGKTNNGDPYTEDCSSTSQSSNWYYYADFSGTIGSQSISDRSGHNFQVGRGANTFNNEMGASGWFHYGNQDGDFNFDLSAPLNCSDNNGNGIIDICENGNNLEGQQDEQLYFTAVKDGRDVALSWVTNTDYKNDYFEIEHSTDGINFDLLEEVMSISDSEEYRDYRNSDKDAKVGMNYYRVKQVFFDGTYRYSSVRAVAFDLDVNEFTIYPNPTADDVFISLKDFVGNAGTIQIVNSLGQTVYSQQIDAITADPIRISTTDMSSGVHAVSVQLKDKKTMTELLMIVKR